MVRPTTQDGFPRNYDVLASFANPWLERERHRASSERGFHLAESLPKLKGSHSEELSERSSVGHIIVTSFEYTKPCTLVKLRFYRKTQSIDINEPLIGMIFMLDQTSQY